MRSSVYDEICGVFCILWYVLDLGTAADLCYTDQQMIMYLRFLRYSVVSSVEIANEKLTELEESAGFFRLSAKHPALIGVGPLRDERMQRSSLNAVISGLSINSCSGDSCFPHLPPHYIKPLSASRVPLLYPGENDRCRVSTGQAGQERSSDDGQRSKGTIIVPMF